MHKGILNLKPIIPKQMTIFDPGIILKQFLKQLDNEILFRLLSKE